MNKSGLNNKRRKKKDEMKRMADIHKLMKGEKVTVKKVRGKDKGVRKRDEDKIRNSVIKELRKHGIKVYRIENSITGKKNTGLADLLAFNPHKNLSAWLEVKTPTGTMQDNQKIFSELCWICKMNYYIVRSADEALDVMKIQKKTFRVPKDINEVYSQGYK